MSALTETRNSSMLNGARAVSFSISSSLDQSADNVARLKFVEGSELATIVSSAAAYIENARTEMAKVVRAVLELSAADFARLQDQANV